MKNLILKGMIVTVLLSLIFVSSYAQTAVTADTIKNTCSEGSTSDILIKLCDSTVMKINASDYSVKINGTTYFDTIRAKLIHAGDSSIVSGTTTITGGTTTDFVATSVLNRQITFGWTNQNGSTLTNNFKGVSIGTVPANYLLNLYKPGTSGAGSGVSVFQQFTNDAGTGSSSGFRFGINHNAGNGLNNVEFRNYENANMDFFTNNQPRMRIYRSAGTNNGNVGIGDFQTYTANFKLHVFGDMGIKTVPVTTSTAHVLVWDDATEQVMRNDAFPIGTGNVTSCTTQTTGFLPRYTTTNPSAPEICNSIVFDNGAGNVGIGGLNTDTRLTIDYNRNFNSILRGQVINVVNTNTSTGETSALEVSATGSATTNFGMRLKVSGGNASQGLLIRTQSATTINRGEEIQSTGGIVNDGLIVNLSNGTNRSMGVGSYVLGEPGSTTWAIYADASGGIENWSGQFHGRAGGTEDWFNFSDSTLKTNVHNFYDGLSIINQLKPKTYVFDTVTYSYLHLPSQNQFGLIGQDVSSILPELTAPMTTPATYDSVGNIIDSSKTFTSLKYGGLIPILVAGVKQLDSIQTKIDTSTWSLHGNSINAGNYIGSNNYEDLKLVTDSTARVTISKDGDVALVNNLTIGGTTSLAGAVATGSPVTVNGDGYFYGDVYATGNFYPSDLKLKQDIEPLTGPSALQLIDALQPRTYTFKANEFPTLALPTVKQYGLISEEVEKVLPTLVKDTKSPPKLDSLGRMINTAVEYKSLNYTEFIPILIAAVKQLDSVNNSLQQQLTQLQNCCSQNNGQTLPGGRVQQSVELSNAIVLDQNSPNPFAEQTIITYTIPETVTEAKIIFYTVTGSVLKTVTITSKGEGALTVYASNLSSGIYLYSLVADGQTIDTKKMTKMR